MPNISPCRICGHTPSMVHCLFDGTELSAYTCDNEECPASHIWPMRLEHWNAINQPARCGHQPRPAVVNELMSGRSLPKGKGTGQTWQQLRDYITSLEHDLACARASGIEAMRRAERRNKDEDNPCKFSEVRE